MAPSGAVPEIIEYIEVQEQVYNLDKSITSISNSKEDEADQRAFQRPVENELDWILNSIDRKISKNMGTSRQKALGLLQNYTQKKRVGISHPPGIGISESITLKQALRRLCLSHAAEMASMKRLSLPCGSCSPSEAETIEKLYVSMVLQVKEAASSAEEVKMRFNHI